MVRIAVISDIHSNLEAFVAVLKDMPKVDMVLCAGDLVGYAANPNEIVKLVRSKKIRAVMGNHDYASLTNNSIGFNSLAGRAIEWTHGHLTTESADFLSSLPLEIELKLDKWKILMIHGSPRDPLNEYLFPDISNDELANATEDAASDIVIVGHTHVPMKRMILGKLVVNPGGVGQPRDRDPRASYAIIKLGKNVEVEHRRVEYDFKTTAKKIMKAGLPEELGSRLFYGW
ncbi:MAG: metallophosphoesterase family protein [Candidatus Hadarchaeales archaeon]